MPRLPIESRCLKRLSKRFPTDEPYEVIVSGLPLNNFSVESVEGILSQLMKLLKPGGTLSFFEYIAIRRFKAVVSRCDEPGTPSWNRADYRWSFFEARNLS